MKIGCPRCGADIEFDPSSGKLYCEYCGSYSDISEIELNQYEAAKQKENEKKTDDGLDKNPNDFDSGYGASKEQEDLYDEFHCSSCGAQLVTDKTTTITRCVFCGSQQMIKQRLTGKFEPNKVLPFKINKNTFIGIYRNFVNKKILAPNEFRNNPFISETRGLYVPHYIYNYDVISYGRGEAQKREEKTTYYKWFEYQQKEKTLVAVDGSTRLDDSVMSSLEPFYYQDMVDFNPAYLTGFQAEKTDETAEALDMKAESRVIMHTNRAVSKSQYPYSMTGGYKACDLKKTCKPEFAMLPIWFVNTLFQGKKYSYAVNGQTGKVVGEVPLSKAKFYPLMAALCAIALALTIFYCLIVMTTSSSRRSDDDGNGIGGIIVIWTLCVGAPYFGIKLRYKNVKHVLSNPIKTWNTDVVKNIKFSSKREYQKQFPSDDLKHITFQKYNDGKFVSNVDINNMVKDSSNILNKNFTIDKKEL